MEKLNGTVLRVLLAAIPLVGIGWILAVTDYFGIALTFQQVIAVILGIACGASLLKYPYVEKAGILEFILAVIAFCAWFWMAYNFEDWVVSGDELGIDKWGPAVIAITLMMEGLRKSAGRIIAGLVWVLLLYGFVGDCLPGVLEAAVDQPAETIHYLYYDNNGVPGLVLQVVLYLVLAFIIFMMVKVFRFRFLIRSFYRFLLPLTIVRRWRVTDDSHQMLTMQHELFRHIEIEFFVSLQ